MYTEEAAKDSGDRKSFLQGGLKPCSKLIIGEEQKVKSWVEVRVLVNGGEKNNNNTTRATNTDARNHERGQRHLD